MNIFKRLLKIGQAEIHALVEKMEDPISLTEQGIEDMKAQLSETKEAYIIAKALVIKSENAIKDKEVAAQEYERKAHLILNKVKTNELSIERAEKLALEALELKSNLLLEVKSIESEVLIHKELVDEINNKIEVLKFNITNWEKELTSLKAKSRIISASEFANRQIANIDSNSTIDMLKKMKAKIEDENAVNEALNQIVQDKIDKDIDLALKEDSNSKIELLELKKRLGLE